MEEPDKVGQKVKKGYTGVWNHEAKGNTGVWSEKRIGPGGDWCSKENILVFQGATAPLPSGIPTYTVSIENFCMYGSCKIYNIHLSCGWFSTARLIDPRIFRRLGYDDCLVKDGQLLGPAEVVVFQYANSFKYPMEVSNISCVP
ncbi:TPD1 protein homolog 1-like [Andrographis paniculata]|uniref:TPD1 protein homolog 1-like n=1 Tax=Andrographis paniculata TaxID=175694 RepID=UPI0021E98E62|nr:TPD1 protein homolog 1-like [Andrographis paniculata]